MCHKLARRRFPLLPVLPALTLRVGLCFLPHHSLAEEEEEDLLPSAMGTVSDEDFVLRGFALLAGRRDFF